MDDFCNQGIEMQTNLATLSPSYASPNLEMVSRLGWQLGSFHGRYCVAWKGSEEVVLEWTGTSWQRIGGRGTS